MNTENKRRKNKNYEQFAFIGFRIQKTADGADGTVRSISFSYCEAERRNFSISKKNTAKGILDNSMINKT